MGFVSTQLVFLRNCYLLCLYLPILQSFKPWCPLFPQLFNDHHNSLKVWLHLSDILAVISLLLRISNESNNSNNGNRIDRHNSTFLMSPHCAGNCLQYARSSGQGLIMCKSRATLPSVFYMQFIMCHVAWRDSSATEFDWVKITFIIALFYWLKPLSDEGGDETGVPGEKPRHRASESATF